MRYLLVFILMITAFTIKSQDLLLTQHFNNPLLFNSAATGSDTSFTAFYATRKQWKGIPEPYSSSVFSVNKGIDKWGVGASFSNNQVGIGGIIVSNFLASISNRVNITETSDLTVGIQGGLYQKRVDEDAFTFDNQYNPGSGFDGTLPTGENFAALKVAVPDLNVGFLWNYRGDNITSNLGFSISHLLGSNQSFFEEQIQKTQKKYIVHGNLEKKISHKASVLPQVIWARQGDASQVSLGVLGKYELNSAAVEGGVGMRFNDAIFIYAGLYVKSLQIGMSYDYNFSSLQAATGGNGAFELTLKLRLKNSEKKKTKKSSEDKVVTAAFTPLLDTDEDGIVDEEDSCPEEFGIEKYGGCPYKDTDKDGITDDIDQCPEIPGYLYNDGCPFQDADGDGISDKIDKCPEEAGNLANQGCPGNRPQHEEKKMSIDRNNALFMSTVYFDVDSYRLKNRYKRLVAEAAEQLSKNDDWNVVILGHTDIDGDDIYNLNLGENRANVVRDFLIKNGITPQRILTLSYGEQRPADSEVNDTAKAKNRRSEIIMVRSFNDIFLIK